MSQGVAEVNNLFNASSGGEGLASISGGCKCGLFLREPVHWDLCSRGCGISCCWSPHELKSQGHQQEQRILLGWSDEMTLNCLGPMKLDVLVSGWIPEVFAESVERKFIFHSEWSS